MPDTSTLYDDVILDHIKNARNYRVLEHADRKAEGVNPLCGDSFTVYVQLDGEVIRDASFQCSCCGISMASASVMTEAVKGKTVTQARELHRRFIALLSDAAAPEARRRHGRSGGAVGGAGFSLRAAIAPRWPGTRWPRRWRAASSMVLGG